MKTLPLFLALLGGALSSHGEEVASHWDVEIPVPIADGTPSQPTPKPVPMDFEVLTSRTKKMAVTEAPEMNDLPPIKGTINVTVQMVKDPGLPDPPTPLPALPPSDPAVIARLENFGKIIVARNWSFSRQQLTTVRGRFFASIPTVTLKGESPHGLT